MRDSIASPTTAMKWIAIVSSFLLLGCTPPANSPSPDTRVPLPTGVSADKKQFAVTLAQFPASAPAKTRPRSGIGCGGYCVVQVKIEPLGTTTTIDPDNAPAGGQPVAHLINLDASDREAYYKLDPGTDAEYYLWVDRKPSSQKARWTLIRVPTGNGAVTATHQSDLTRCDVHPTAAYSDADFVEFKHPGKLCPHSALAAAPPYSKASMLSTGIIGYTLRRITDRFRRPMLPLMGGWIDCSNGCCT